MVVIMIQTVLCIVSVVTVGLYSDIPETALLLAVISLSVFAPRSRITYLLMAVVSLVLLLTTPCGTVVPHTITTLLVAHGSRLK